jgi:pimeloyl-ACP methyl ester carboxylesterase
MRGLAADSAYLAGVLAQTGGPVLLPGHSYGGAVITDAATGAGNVVGLVYVAAFAPDADERLGDVTARSTDAVLSTASAQRTPVRPRLLSRMRRWPHAHRRASRCAPIRRRLAVPQGEGDRS